MKHRFFVLGAGALVLGAACTSGDTTDVATGYLDMQSGEACEPDMGSYKPRRNNGHGNNEDGIDISNPGRGPKNADGADPSEPIDDEKKLGHGGDDDDDDDSPAGCDAKGCCDDDLFTDAGAPQDDDDDDDSDESYDGDDDDCPGHDDDDDDGPDYTPPSPTPDPAPEPDNDPVL